MFYGIKEQIKINQEKKSTKVLKFVSTLPA